jgi:Photosynthetic reaction centre cytochrome C subunit
MNFNTVLKPKALISAACAAGLLLLPGFAVAQNAKPQVAEDVYKNIKVLRGTPADAFNQAMHLVSGALGVDCEYCHLEKDRVSDEVKKKDIARDMMTMTADLNRRMFKGEEVVTCYTCHRGHPIPVGAPELPVGEYAKEPPPPAAMPSATEVISKYITALGGEQNLRKITSRVITATQDIPTGPGGVIPTPATVEILQKAPNLVYRTAKTKELTQLSGADAKGPWVQDARGRVNGPAIDLERSRETRAANFYAALDIAKDFPKLTVEGKEKIGASETYVVVGVPADGVAVRMYFDVKTGLLLRTYTLTPTQLGPSPYQVDYSDYRDAGHGVKYAYKIHMEPAGARTELATHSTIRISKIQENVALDDAKFTRPPSVDRGVKKKE